MSIALYMDVQVQRAITKALRVRGLDVLTVQDDGMSLKPDSVLLDRAGALDRLMFSRDQDFLAEATRRQHAGEPFIGVVYAHLAKVPIGRGIEDLELIAKASELSEYANSVIHLPFR